jgi:hypothetical protein
VGVADGSRMTVESQDFIVEIIGEWEVVTEEEGDLSQFLAVNRLCSVDVVIGSFISESAA